MLNTTAYLNLLTKQKQILIKMQSHKLNLKHMKSINRNSPQLKPVSINKNKTKYNKSRDQHEIDMENEILTEKIQKIIKSQRNSKYFSKNEKYSKSLNGHVKRTTQEKINQDNLRLLQRLSDSKPTYPTKKYLQEFQHLKKVQKNMSSAEFYLTDSPRFRRRNLSTNRSFITKRDSSIASGNSVRGENGLLVKEIATLNDGKLWQVKIYFAENKNQGLKITGQVIVDSEGRNYQSQLQHKKTRDIKIIQMPMTLANIFIARHCQNKVQNIFNHLKVDQNDRQLMIVVPQKNVNDNKKINSNVKINLPSPTKLINPQEKRTNQVKLKKLQSLAGYEKKKAPSRQIFNTVKNKPTLIDNLLVESNQNVKINVQVQNPQQIINQKQKRSEEKQKQQKYSQTHQSAVIKERLKNPSVKSIKEKNIDIQAKQFEIQAQNKNEDNENHQQSIEKVEQSLQENQIKKETNTGIQNEKIVQLRQVNKKQTQDKGYDQQQFEQSTTKMKPIQNKAGELLQEKQQTTKPKDQEIEVIQQQEQKQKITNQQKQKQQSNEKLVESKKEQETVKENHDPVQNEQDEKQNKEQQIQQSTPISDKIKDEEKQIDFEEKVAEII